MAFPLTVAKAVFRWDQANNTEAINVLHIGRSPSADFGTAQCQAVAEDLHDWYSNSNFKTETNNPLRQFVDTATSLREIVVSDVGPGPTVQYTENVGQAGANAGTPLPIESAWVSTWRTLVPGRSGRGRTFWPGANTSIMDDAGGIAAVNITSMEETLQALIDGWETAGSYYLGVFSPLHSVNNIVTSVTVQSVIHHQKRRNH